MPIPAALAGMLGDQSGQIAEAAVQGLGTLLSGLDSIINPQIQVPPMSGMTSSDFMQMGLGAIMAAANTRLAFAKQQARTSNIAGDDELFALINKAENSRQKCALKFGAKAMANKAAVNDVPPTKEDVHVLCNATRRILAIHNTQRAQLSLYRKNMELGANFDFRGLLKKIVNGVDKIFGYADKAKTVYDKAKPYLEKI